MRLLKYTFCGLLIFIMLGCTQQDRAENMELIGHRGATALAPENTIPGFKKAVELGADGIEMDVVISGDEKVVVSHEPWFRHDICLTPEGDSLNQNTQRDHRIYEMNYDQIAEYDCGSLQRPGYPEQKNELLSKPLLSDVITEVEAAIEENDYDSITYNVEIKSDSDWDNNLQPVPEETARLVYNELADLEILNQVRIFAFDPRVLNAFNEIDSSIPRVYLISASQITFSDNISKLTAAPDVYAPNYGLVDANLVEKVHSDGMQLIPWTANDYENMVRLINLGVDGIVSDYPNYFEKLRDEVGTTVKKNKQ